MSNEQVYIDSMIWIGALNPKDNKHRKSKRILNKLLLNAKEDSILLSDYVFNEILSNIANKQKYHKLFKNQKKELCKESA